MHDQRLEAKANIFRADGLGYRLGRLPARRNKKPLSIKILELQNKLIKTRAIPSNQQAVT